MTFQEMNKILKGKVSKEEKYFRCFIAHVIDSEGIQTLYNTKKFCEYLIIIGEKDGGEMFNFLKQRREEFLENTQDIILKQLMVVK
jgi:hypothetical protein